MLGRACVWASCVVAFCLFSAVLNAQAPDPAPETDRPVPILTGNAGFFTNVNGGQTELVPSITPVLLVPLGDRWLVESRAEFTGEFERLRRGWILRRQGEARNRLSATGLHRQPLFDCYRWKVPDSIRYL